MTKEQILSTIKFKEEDIFNTTKYADLKERLLCLALMREDFSIMTRVLAEFRRLFETVQNTAPVQHTTSEVQKP